MALPVRRLSPVSITGRMPSAFRRATLAAASSRLVSQGDKPDEALGKQHHAAASVAYFLTAAHSSHITIEAENDNLARRHAGGASPNYRLRLRMRSR